MSLRSITTNSPTRIAAGVSVIDIRGDSGAAVFQSILNSIDSIASPFLPLLDLGNLR